MTRSQQISLMITALITVLGFVLLCVISLSHSAEEWPPKPQPYIELAQNEEFIEPIVLPQPVITPGTEAAPALTPEDLDNPSSTAPETGTHISAEGKVAKPAQVVTSERESEVKIQTKPQPQESGANKEKQKRDRELDERTNNDIESAFANNNAKNNADNQDKDTGKSGRKDGVADSHGRSDSHSRAKGDVLNGGFAWPTLSTDIKATNINGKIVIIFTINPDGSVQSTKIGPGTNILNGELRRKCENFVKSLKFPHKGGARPERPVPGNKLTLTFTNAG